MPEKSTYAVYEARGSLRNCGGLESSVVRRIKELGAEDPKLRRINVDLALDNAAMKDLVATELGALRIRLARTASTAVG